jgi:hypothetical protein
MGWEREGKGKWCDGIDLGVVLVANQYEKEKEKDATRK